MSPPVVNSEPVFHTFTLLAGPSWLPRKFRPTQKEWSTHAFMGPYSKTSFGVDPKNSRGRRFQWMIVTQRERLLKKWIASRYWQFGASVRPEPNKERAVPTDGIFMSK